MKTVRSGIDAEIQRNLERYGSSLYRRESNEPGGMNRFNKPPPFFK